MVGLPMSDPFERFATWYAEAVKAIPEDPNAMVLSTVGTGGRPSARVVLLKGFDARGFVFYTNLESRKGRELAAHPAASLNFHFRPLGRQVRVEGLVEKVSPEEADTYFATRPRGSQVGAWASTQSAPLPKRATASCRTRLNSGWAAKTACTSASCSCGTPRAPPGRCSTSTPEAPCRPRNQLWWWAAASPALPWRSPCTGPPSR